MSRSRCYFAVPVILAFAGCGIDDGPSAPEPPALLTTATQVVDAFEVAMKERDLGAYIALLEPPPTAPEVGGFSWYPSAADLDDFPWLTGAESWGFAAEVEMVSHMFDSTFVSGTTGHSIASIHADLELETEEAVSELETRAECHSDFRVLWAEQDGLRADTRLEFLLVRDAAGAMTIRSIRESSLLGGARSVDPVSVSSMKNFYR